MQGERSPTRSILTLVGATCLGHAETNDPPFHSK